MNKTWWKEALVYQIYPRSYKDSNGDGIGDLRGIIEKLDYIKSLGIDVIWLCPVYQSPNDDNGYDISDYYGIMDEFGTMADYDELLEGVHARGMKLIMDLVVNHTSDEHAWFIESRSSKESPKRDYYIWKPGKNGGPPNNWQSFFGGDAWLYDELTDEYFLHLFTKKQPDLNWENPQVRAEVYNLMKFWLDKGVDGFRMDVISLLSKRHYEDSPYREFRETIQNLYANGPRIHEFLQEMNREVMSKYDVMTVGEGPGIDMENGIKYVAEDRKELNMIFHFDHMFIDWGEEGKFTPVPYSLVTFKKIFADWDRKLANVGWGSIFLGNHDFPRITSRYANDQEYRVEAAKLLCLMMMSMRGTPYVYQGEEIGMTNVAFDSIDDYDDIETKNVYQEWKEKGRDLDQLMKAIHEQGRDNARTPVQWSDQSQAGFTSGTPWIRVNPNYKEINVLSQEGDPDSVLHFYRKMIQVRKENPSLVYGEFEDMDPQSEQVYVFKRWDDDVEFLVALNFSSEQLTYNLDCDGYSRLIGNYNRELRYRNGQLTLDPWEAILLQKNQA